MNRSTTRIDSPCCQLSKSISGEGDSEPQGIRTPGWWKRFLAILGWILPSTVLALMPKCPACFAAYIAAATGLGISFSIASYMRSIAMVSCVGLLVIMIAVSSVYFLRRTKRGPEC